MREPIKTVEINNALLDMFIPVSEQKGQFMSIDESPWPMEWRRDFRSEIQREFHQPIFCYSSNKIGHMDAAHLD